MFWGMTRDLEPAVPAGADFRFAAASRYREAVADIPELLELAADACDAPMAALKVADSAAAHFAVTLGIPAAADVPAPLSLCTMVSAAGDTMVVGDATRDPRVSGHPLVAGSAHVRFLAAAPLHYGEHIVGALCVFDTASHHNDPDRTRRLLARIARRIDRETQLRDRLTAGSALGTLVERDDVVSVVSHEIRTPLAAIRGNLELLTELSAAAPPHFQRRLDVLTRNTSRLTHTVDSLMRAIDQHPTARPEVVDLGALVAAAAQADGIRHTVAAEPVWVIADPALLSLAVEHLVRNAVVHGPGDRPATVSVLDQPQPAVVVRDHGPGLDPAEHAQLTTAFFRGRRACHDERPGLGLGLTISERIVTAHGGVLELDNATGGGTVARILLPSYS